MNIAVVMGTRPNVVKCAALVPALRKAGASVTVIHTGQHADEKMSGELFLELGVSPDVHLARPEGATSAERFASMTLNLARWFAGAEYDLVIVVGDCDSTLAAALAAKKCGLKVAHVEAGLRADDVVQENLNRILVDSMSDELFCSEQAAWENLQYDDIHERHACHLVGNVMIDVLRKFESKAIDIGAYFGYSGKSAGEYIHDKYALLTLHRQETVDGDRLWDALRCAEIVVRKMPVLFPLHPRTEKRLFNHMDGFVQVKPLGYVQFLAAMMHATLVLTDSGGVQEETTALGVPCLTLREQTERPATITCGTNELVGFDAEKVRVALERIERGEWKKGRGPTSWDGHAAERIAEILIGKFAEQVA